MVNNPTNINKWKKITSHLNSMNIKQKYHDNDVVNPCIGLGQAQTCGEDKPVNEIPV